MWSYVGYLVARWAVVDRVRELTCCLIIIIATYPWPSHVLRLFFSCIIQFELHGMASGYDRAETITL